MLHPDPPPAKPGGVDPPDGRPPADRTTGLPDPDDDLASLLQRIESLEQGDHRLIAAECRLADIEAELAALRAQVTALLAERGGRR